MRIPDLILVAPWSDVSGIAGTVRELYLALFDLGIKVKLIEISNWSHIKVDLDPETREKLEFGANRNDLQQPVAIYCYPPHHYANFGMPNIQGTAFNVSHTVFETDKAPLVWRDILNNPMFTENWVNCKFNVDAYSSVGIDKNKLRVLTLGVNTDKFNPEVKPLAIDDKKKFTIMTAFDWSVRKNPEGMISAFMQEFNNDPDVGLVVKAYTGYADENSKNQIRQNIQKLRMMTMSKANISLITDFLHSDLMPSFHKAADVWLNLSRGEGHDMGALQSMACGVPVVGAYNTAHEMYLTSKNGYPVQCKRAPITNKDFLARNPQFLDSSWQEPDIKDARKQMRQAYEDWKSGKLQEKGLEARKTASDYTWKKTALKVIFNTGKYFQ